MLYGASVVSLAEECILGGSGKTDCAHPIRRAGQGRTVPQSQPCAVLLKMLPKDLSSPYPIPDGSRCPVGCFQTHKNKRLRPPTQDKLRSMDWSIFIWTLPAHSNSWCTGYTVQGMSLCGARRRLLAAAAVAVMKLVCNNQV